MRKLLIAESSPLAMNAMAQLFSDEWELQLCRSSFETVNALRRSRPDAAILSHHREEMDVFEILAECFPDLPTVLVVTTPSAMMSDVRNLARWGVDLVFEIPCDQKLLKRYTGLLYQNQSAVTRRVAQHLRVLGFSSGASSYFCLLLAICYFSEDLSQQLHNDVYRRVAKTVSGDERSVEKGIRTIIRNAWERRDNAMWAKYFPVDENGEVACPKNKEFLMSLATQLV